MLIMKVCKLWESSSRMALPLAFKAIDAMKAWLNSISKGSEVI